MELAQPYGRNYFFPAKNGPKDMDLSVGRNANFRLIFVIF